MIDILKTAAILIAIGIFNNAIAETRAVYDQKQEQEFIQNYASKYNLPPKYIQDTLSQAIFQTSTYNAQVATITQKSKTWKEYHKQFINPILIKRGQRFMCTHKKILDKASTRYGVPAYVIVGIIGVETSYGSFTGNYRVLDTLATLAFNSPKRIDFWQNELAQYLLMCFLHKLSPVKMIGAIDGGFGLGQFMPSSYMDYAVSAVPDKTPNLMHPDDAIMSVANYLSQHGWQHNQPVILNVKYKKDTCEKLDCNKRKLSYPVKIWKENGVYISSHINDDTIADLIILEDFYTSHAWLALNNFYTIFSYNHSHKYVMAVYQLGRAVSHNISCSGL